MGLTESQEQLLYTDITVTHQFEFADEVANSDDQAIAHAYNAPADPTFWVWKTALTKEEVVGPPSEEGTTFTWAGNGFIGRSVGELTAWQELFSGETLITNPSFANVRQAFQDIFSGTGNAANNRTHLGIVMRRAATRAEQLFATGQGTTTAPATMTFEGPLTYLDIAGVFGRG
jgi:hypothetical protein